MPLTILNAQVAGSGPGSSAGFEPQRKNNWIVAFSVPGLNLATEDIFLALKSFPFPIEKTTRKTIRWFNESRHYAGSVADFGEQSLVVRDYIDRDTALLLYSWRRLVWNPLTGNVGLAKNYKGSGMLYLAPPGNSNLDLTGDDLTSDEVSRKMFLQGCFPTEFDMGDFDMDNEGDQVEIKVAISIDRAYAAGADGQGDFANFLGGRDL